MLGIISRNVHYEALHGIDEMFMTMSKGNDDKQCKLYPLASAMSMNYVVNSSNLFQLKPSIDVNDDCDLKCVLKRMKNSKSTMELNNGYDSHLILKNYGIINIESLNDLFNALDKYNILYSGIITYEEFEGVDVIALYADEINEISHATVITSVGKFDDVPGIYAEVVNGWSYKNNCGGIVYIKIANDENSELKNNMNLFGFNAWIETEYSGSDENNVYFIVMIVFVVLFVFSLVVIGMLFYCNKHKDNGNRASV